VGDELLRVVRLGQEVPDAQLEKGLFVLPDDRGAANHHLLRRASQLHPPTDLDTRENGQVQVDQQQIERTFVVEAVNPLTTILGLGDLEPFTPQELGDEAPEDLLVFHQEQRASPFHRLTILPGDQIRSVAIGAASLEATRPAGVW
jgi:hypothetical protein